MTARLFAAAAMMALVWTLITGARAEPAVPAAGPPLPDATIQRVAFGSCADQRQPQTFWTAILEARPQLFVMLGDNVYGDSTAAGMPEMRAAYADLAKQPGFRAARAAVPFLVTWDDHDYGVNDGGADYPRRAESARLFREFWDQPADGARTGATDDGVYAAYGFGPPGARLQIILLDTRSFRSALKVSETPRSPGSGRYLPDDDPGKTMLGEGQWAWLGERLREPADLRFVVSSVQVLPEGHGFERWGNLPREQERLFALIRDTGANGVVFISGDRHFSAFYRRVEGTPYPFYELTASSLNRPFLANREQDPRQISDAYRWGNFEMAVIDWTRRRLTLETRDWDDVVARSIVVDIDAIQAN